MVTSGQPPRRSRRRPVLTPRRRKIVKAIEDYLRDHGCSPSSREIADGADLASVSSVSHHLQALRAAGFVTYEDGRPRTVRVLRSVPPAGVTGEMPAPTRPAGDGTPGESGGGKVVWVPIVGRIAAGRPITIPGEQQPVEDFLPLPKEVVGSEEGLFILEVTGDSMIGVGILAGDWVVLRQLFQQPQNGDIVAATIDGTELEGTVKTYKKVGRHVWLMPQNPAHTPIPGGKAQFAGKVVAVLRRV